MVMDESCSRRKDWAEGCRALIWNMMGLRTPLSTNAATARLGSFHRVLMARFLLLWLSSLFLFFHFVSSHLVEIPASKKECFFEDLHINDQVLHVHLFASIQAYLAIVPDDSHVPGWRRRPLGH
jgi:hypothetical protein